VIVLWPKRAARGFLEVGGWSRTRFDISRGFRFVYFLVGFYSAGEKMRRNVLIYFYIRSEVVLGRFGICKVGFREMYMYRNTYYIIILIYIYMLLYKYIYIYIYMYIYIYINIYIYI
jgi:hypothetical protein